MNTCWLFVEGKGLSVKIEDAAGMVCLPPGEVRISMTPRGQFRVIYYPPSKVKLSKLELNGDIEELVPYNSRYNKVTLVRVWFENRPVLVDVSNKKFLMPL